MLIIFECSIKDGFRHIWASSQRFSHTLTFFKVENMFSFLRIDMIYSRTFTFEVSSGMMLWWANWTWFIQPFYTHIYSITWTVVARTTTVTEKPHSNTVQRNVENFKLIFIRNSSYRWLADEREPSFTKPIAQILFRTICACMVWCGCGEGSERSLSGI